MPQLAHVETPFTSSEKIRDTVIGVSSNTLTVPLALAAGLINPSKTMRLKLSTIYSPPNHTNGTTPTTKRSFADFGARGVCGSPRRQRILLAGAVAHYTLLAMVPLFVVFLVGLSHVVDEYRRPDTVASNLQPWTPRHLRRDP